MQGIADVKLLGLICDPAYTVASYIVAYRQNQLAQTIIDIAMVVHYNRCHLALQVQAEELEVVACRSIRQSAIYRGVVPDVADWSRVHNIIIGKVGVAFFLQSHHIETLDTTLAGLTSCQQLINIWSCVAAIDNAWQARAVCACSHCTCVNKVKAANDLVLACDGVSMRHNDAAVRSSACLDSRCC